MLRVTLDTTEIDEQSLAPLREREAAGELDLAVVTVTKRELSEVALLDGFEIVGEIAVFDESLWGHAVWAGDEDAVRLEAILKVIGNGSFPRPSKREELTEGQRHQLRDAMIFEAHARSGRDVFVTGDRKAFVTHGKREQLEQLCQTRIRTAAALHDELDSSLEK